MSERAKSDQHLRPTEHIALFLQAMEIKYEASLRETKKTVGVTIPILMTATVAYAGAVNLPLLTHIGYLGGASLMGLIVYLYIVEHQFAVNINEATEPPYDV